MGGEGGGNAIDDAVNDLVGEGDDGDGEPELGNASGRLTSRNTRRHINHLLTTVLNSLLKPDYAAGATSADL
jgi:hypothetical protein